MTFGTSKLLVFTDASIRLARAGIGVYSQAPCGLATKFAASATARVDINELEMMAIFAALQVHDPRRDMVVHSDSQTALNAIAGRRSSRKYDRMLDKIMESLERRSGDTSFVKVKAHSGVRGNEIADALAGRGSKHALATFDSPVAFVDVPTWRTHHVRDDHVVCIFSSPDV